MKYIQNNRKEESWVLRNIIALIITGFVVGVTILIAVYLLFVAKDPNLDFIGKSLLPLWGTWIGTVLAFYFGKANFEAASKSYQDVIRTLTPDEKIAQLPVKDIMIPFEKIESLAYEVDKDVSISNILNYVRFNKYNRFAVFENKNIFKYMIHRSTFYQFIAQKVDENLSNVEIKKLTLLNLIEGGNNDIKGMLLKGYNFISIKANLLDAKNAIEAMTECQDVFVTESGKSTEPVLGLITNNIIMEKAKI
ncbi:MAG: hypothetical protein NTZ33_15675 [Bacteroidetes bacterium]|nr:hypothetical protein [Bacteroidota bacterium]